MSNRRPTFSGLASFAVALCIAALPTASRAQSISGVPNFRRINDRLSRGGQPTEEGFRNLAATGVHTVLDLREKDERSKGEKHLVHDLGMRYVNIPMKGMHTPSDKQIAHALRILKDKDAGPVFVHCKRGADRTGVVLACYRIEQENWRNEDALREARDMGMHWYDLPLQRYVMAYRPQHRNPIEQVGDSTVDALRKLPGLGGILK